MAIKVGVRRFERDGKKYVAVCDTPNDRRLQSGTWITPTQARKLASRLLVAANMAELDLFLKKGK